MTKLQTKLYIIIFESNTFSGKAFDLGLIVTILASILVMMLESISNVQIKYHHTLISLEWIFTIIFSIEYIFRLYCSKPSKKYARSFFGIIDMKIN